MIETQKEVTQLEEVLLNRSPGVQRREGIITKPLKFRKRSGGL